MTTEANSRMQRPLDLVDPEIAELLRIPINTVRSKLFRSRLALKCHLEPEREGVKC